MPTNTFRNGLVAVSVFVGHICRTVERFGPAFTAAIDAAVTAGKITSAEGAQIKAAISAVTAVCDLLKAATR